MNILGRWVKEQNEAHKLQIRGKSASDRFVGYRRAQSSFAMLMLVALVPTLLAIPFAPWSSASFFGRAVIVAVCLWCALVMAIGGFFIVRTLVRIGRRSDG